MSEVLSSNWPREETTCLVGKSLGIEPTFIYLFSNYLNSLRPQSGCDSGTESQ